MSPDRSHTSQLDSPLALPLLPQACKRCYSRKRKCDRKQPRCSLCEEVDAECVVELRSTEKRLIEQLNQSKKRIADLEQRLHHTETNVNQRDEVLSNPAWLRDRESPEGLLSESSSPVLGLSSLALSGLLLGPAHSPVDDSHTIVSDTGLLPPKEETLHILRTYMSGFKQSHHLLEISELEADTERIYEGDGMTSPDAAASRFRCLGTLAAYTKDVRNVTDDAQYVFCTEICSKALPLIIAREDLVAVQAFGMLAWWAIGEPGGPNLFQVVGLATRTALSLRIHRRDDIYFALLPPIIDPDAKRRHNEKRKDVFWAVYCLDRLTMHVLGLPPGIRDQDIDVDLPTIPITVAGDNSVPSTALRIHNIKQRRLYGIIQDRFYAINSSPIAREEADLVVGPYVKDIREWYESSPLKTAFVPISQATISKQCLDDLCYHQMILALHRPSPLISDIPSSFVTVLLQSSGTSVDLYWHYWKSKQILINWIHLYQIFISCSTLVYCFGECENRPELSPVPGAIVDLRIKQSTELLTNFAPLWPHSPEFRRMFDTLVISFESQRAAKEGVINVAAADPSAINFSTLFDLMLPVDGMDLASQARLEGFTPEMIVRNIWE